MSYRLLALAAVLSVSMLPSPAPAAETNPAATELTGLVNRIKDRLRQGARTEQELAPEIQQFDELLAKYKAEKNDAAASILTTKAMLYLEVFTNTDKAITYIRQSKQDFPETQTAKNADELIATIQYQEKVRAIQRSQVEGAPFPDLQATDLDGKPASISAYKGKILLVDFWATWCGPCMRELPNVLAAYQKYHPHGFDIIGITLDTDESALRSFVKAKNIAWQQVYEGKRWDNTLVQKYAVESIPCTFLLDREGKILAKNLTGPDLDLALAKLLPIPAPQPIAEAPPPPARPVSTIGASAALIVGMSLVALAGIVYFIRSSTRPPTDAKS